MFLLKQTGVASVPGEAFFHNGNGKDLLRFCFAKTDRELQEACNSLEALSPIPRLSVTSPSAN
jgi:aminotransferase